MSISNNNSSSSEKNIDRDSEQTQTDDHGELHNNGNDNESSQEGPPDLVQSTGVHGQYAIPWKYIAVSHENGTAPLLPSFTRLGLSHSHVLDAMTRVARCLADKCLPEFLRTKYVPRLKRDWRWLYLNPVTPLFSFNPLLPKEKYYKILKDFLPAYQRKVLVLLSSNCRKILFNPLTNIIQEHTRLSSNMIGVGTRSQQRAEEKGGGDHQGASLRRSLRIRKQKGLAPKSGECG